jgi:hypothetical protein
VCHVSRHMAHPCQSSNPPAWCNRKRSRKAGKKSTCSCPSGWTRKGIICQKGRTKKRASCAR